MIKEKTVFVLGAGASKPFGFPTGAELKTNICKNFIDKLKICDLEKLRDIGLFPDEILRRAQLFINSFAGTPDLSIDSYININESFSYLAKKAIIFEILNCEKKLQDKFSTDTINIDYDWFGYLFREMLEETYSLETFFTNKVSFITFNYDSSLEYLFLKSLKNQFIDSEIKEILKFNEKIKIIHVYGRVSNPFMENRQNIKDGYRFGENAYFYGFDDQDVNNILTISERSGEQNVDIRNELNSAKRIFILGFGFNKENVDMLKFDANKEQWLFATGIGLTEKETIKKKSYLIKITKIQGLFSNIFIDENCYSLLRNHL